MSSRTVLVVDDEGPIRAIVAAMLACQGYRTIEAKDGYEALGVAGQMHVDVVVTDCVMPGMRGPELIRQLKDRGCGACYLLISGDAGNAPDRTYEQVPFLTKPFTLKQLLAAIDDVALSSG